MTRSGTRGVTLFVALPVVLATVVAAPAAASDRHSWCLVVQDWGDGWACGYDTFAQCQAEARAGNTGYCAANPYYPAPPPKPTPRQSKRRSRRGPSHSEALRTSLS